MNKAVRNLVIFTLVAIGGGFSGILIDRLAPPPNPMQGLGILIWLVSPFIANLLLRGFGGDGWKDFGLRPKLMSSWKWYLVALIVPLFVTLFSLILGSAFGAVSVSNPTGPGINALILTIGAAFGANAIKNVFEEFSWRGYLTPRFEAIGLHPFSNALFTGLIWAGWHIPYYLYFLDRKTMQEYTWLSVPALILLAFLVLPLQALAYGELRLLSGSVWSAWLMHSTANALGLSLILSGSISVLNNPLGILLTPGTEGIVYSLLMGMIGILLFRQRRKRTLSNNYHDRSP